MESLYKTEFPYKHYLESLFKCNCNSFASHMYPNELNEIKHIVEKECDKLDYPGSMIYDEMPDKIYFYKICSNLSHYALLNCSYGKKCCDLSRLNDIICIFFIEEIKKKRKHNQGLF